MAESAQQSQEKNSKVYTLYYAFFLIPLMITIFGVMFFFMFKVLTYETNSPHEYLTDVQIGSATKRWQSAYELSKLLSNPELVPLDLGFKKYLQFENFLLHIISKLFLVLFFQISSCISVNLFIKSYLSL